MKSMIGKLAAIAMGPLMALALYSGVARSVTITPTCAPSSQDAFFYKSQIKIIKGTGGKTDTLIFTGKLVNEDPTVECFQGLDPVNGCGGAVEAGDDFIEGGGGVLGFALNDSTACNLESPNNFFQFTMPAGFTKVNDNKATFSGPATAVDNKGINTSATVDATVWRDGPSKGAPNYNYTDGTCGTFRFQIQVTNINLQGISPTLVSNPLTWNVNFGDNSFGCFPTTDAKICSAPGGGCSSGD
jgi:hypothetical protein